MNRISDKYYMPSSYAQVYEDPNCQHICEHKLYKILAPYRGVVRCIIKYCTHCGLITDGL